MRVKAELWVKAYIRRCDFHGVYAIVVQRGDGDAGAIYIKINNLDGTAQLFTPAPAGFEEGSTDRKWISWRDDSHKNEEDIDGYLAKQRQSDPDIWIVEVEDKGGRSFLEEDMMIF